MFINITVKSGSYLLGVLLCEERDHLDFVTGYNKHVFYKFLTITHIVKEVILRTIKEGTKIAKRRETE